MFKTLSTKQLVLRGPVVTAVTVRNLGTTDTLNSAAQEIEKMKDQTNELTALIRKLKEENKIDIQVSKLPYFLK